MSRLSTVGRFAFLTALAAPVAILPFQTAVAAAPAKVQKVAIDNFAFAPQVIVVAPGTMV